MRQRVSIAYSVSLNPKNHSKTIPHRIKESTIHSERQDSGLAFLTQQIAGARSAILLGGVAVESLLASVAVVAFGIVETLLALASLLVAGSRVVQIDVVVADAGFAAAAGSPGIAEVVVGAFVALRARVALLAIASARKEKNVTRIEINFELFEKKRSPANE